MPRRATHDETVDRRRAALIRAKIRLAVADEFDLAIAILAANKRPFFAPACREAFLAHDFLLRQFFILLRDLFRERFDPRAVPQLLPRKRDSRSPPRFCLRSRLAALPSLVCSRFSLRANVPLLARRLGRSRATVQPLRVRRSLCAAFYAVEACVGLIT